MDIVGEAIKKGESLRHTRIADHTGKQQMSALKNKNGIIIKNRDKLSKIEAPQTDKRMGTSDIPEKMK